MAIFARFVGSGVYRIPGTDLLSVEVNYVDQATPSTPLYGGPFSFNFPRTKAPSEVGAEIVAKGLALAAAEAQAQALAAQFPVASTFIQIQ